MSATLKGNYGSIPLCDIAALKIKYTTTNPHYNYEIVAVSKELKTDVTLGCTKFDEEAKQTLTTYNKLFETYLLSKQTTKSGQNQ